MSRLLALLMVTVSLSACASVLDRSTQEVTVLTPGAYDSVCYINNGEIIYRVWPPQTQTISKRPGDLTVRCLADGNREKTMVFKPEHQSVVLANTMVGVMPGLFVDHETGAMFAYPNTITVDFTDMPAQAMERPSYDKHLADNPHLFGMEEFRPGQDALISDQYESSHELRKRENPGQGPTYGEFSTIEDSAKPAMEPASAEGGAKTSAGNPQSDLVSDLTRKMNPQVFGPAPASTSEPVPAASGFVGGTGASGEEEDQSGTSSAAPVAITPVQGQ